MILPKCALPIIFLAALAGCSTTKYITKNVSREDHSVSYSNKVAILVPLTGANAAIGNEIMKACMLAVQKYPNVEVITIDSEQIKNNLDNVVKEIRDNKIDYVIGPVFSRDVSIIASAMPDITFLSMSNDATMARGNTIMFGLSPEDEIISLFNHAVKLNSRKILAFVPEGNYGNIVGNAINNADLGDTYVRKVRYHQLTKNDVKAQLAEADFDAVFCVSADLIPSDISSKILVMLPYNTKNASSEGVNNSLICAPNQAGKGEFETYFQSKYGKKPADISIIGYEIANIALSACTTHKVPFDILEHTYNGVYGDFYVGSNGMVTREWKMYRNIK